MARGAKLRRCMAFFLHRADTHSAYCVSYPFDDNLRHRSRAMSAVRYRDEELVHRQASLPASRSARSPDSPSACSSRSASAASADSRRAFASGSIARASRQTARVARGRRCGDDDDEFEDDRRATRIDDRSRRRLGARGARARGVPQRSDSERARDRHRRDRRRDHRARRLGGDARGVRARRDDRARRAGRGDGREPHRRSATRSSASTELDEDVSTRATPLPGERTGKDSASARAAAARATRARSIVTPTRSRARGQVARRRPTRSTRPRIDDRRLAERRARARRRRRAIDRRLADRADRRAEGRSRR